MAEIKVKVQTTKLETKSKIVEEKKEGEVIDRDIITTVTLEYNGTPGKMDDVLYTLRAGHPVDVVFSSPQRALDLPKADKEVKEPAEAKT